MKGCPYDGAQLPRQRVNEVYVLTPVASYFSSVRRDELKGKGVQSAKRTSAVAYRKDGQVSRSTVFVLLAYEMRIFFCAIDFASSVNSGVYDASRSYVTTE